MNAAQLKASILQQAIEGKLVPQLQEEVVVEQIGDVPTEVPFEIPGSWKWMSLKSVGAVVSGATPKTSVNEFWNGDINWVTPADLGKNSSKWIAHGSRFLSKDGLNSCSAVLMPKGSIVYSSRAPIGHIAIAANELCTNQGCKSFVPKNEYISTEWAYYVLIARTKDIQSRASGTTFKEISGTGMGNTLIPLPPLAEQKRIVAKIEELMPLVEEYGKAYDKLQELNDELPGKLKASILQEAIQGKLVPQLPEDGVVEQIGNAPEEAPFDIPNSWKWYTLGNLIEYGNCKQVAGKDITSSTWVLDLEDIEKNTGKIIEKKRNVKSTSNKNVFEEGDVLYSKLRPYLNKVVIADETGVCTTEIIPINVKTAKVPLLPHYLQFCLMSPSFLNYANRCSYGVKMPRLGTNDAKAAYIPVPPLAEQKRIVAKLETLLKQVDLMIK